VNAVVTASLAIASTAGLPAAPRPEFAARMLAVGEVGVRAHVPPGSALLDELSAMGVEGIESIDATLSCGDPAVVDIAFATKNAETARATAAQVKGLILSVGGVLGPLARATMEWGDNAQHMVAVDGGLVRVRVRLAHAKLPTLETYLQQWIQESIR
jgi:hypothetical protein